MSNQLQHVDTLLSSTVTIAKYLAAERGREQATLASFIHQRFDERYVRPFERNNKKNGFIMMASSCLMIEAIESFWCGWKKSPTSALVFCQFFDRVERFAVLRGRAQEFYKNVRCGILHQGETTGGWHVRRDLIQLFDQDTLTLDATRFLAELSAHLSDYKQTLIASPWNDPVWKNFRRKMKSVCENAKA